jgi:hypothetical protein
VTISPCFSHREKSWSPKRCCLYVTFSILLHHDFNVLLLLIGASGYPYPKVHAYWQENAAQSSRDDRHPNQRRSPEVTCRRLLCHSSSSLWIQPSSRAAPMDGHGTVGRAWVSASPETQFHPSSSFLSINRSLILFTYLLL